jgi:hypothetical protein
MPAYVQRWRFLLDVRWLDAVGDAEPLCVAPVISHSFCAGRQTAPRRFARSRKSTSAKAMRTATISSSLRRG